MKTQLLRRFWDDDSGYVLSAELVLVASVLAIGLTVGLASLRNQVVQELVDVGQAVGSLDQSYAYCGVGKCGVGFTAGSFYYDQIDFCQDPGQQPGTEPGGISVRVCPRCPGCGHPMMSEGLYGHCGSGCPCNQHSQAHAQPEHLQPIPETPHLAPPKNGKPLKDPATAEQYF